MQYDRAPAHTGLAAHHERPHTISTAYERGHQRAALSVYTFQPLDAHSNHSCSSDKVDRHHNQNGTPLLMLKLEGQRHLAAETRTQFDVTPNKFSALPIDGADGQVL